VDIPDVIVVGIDISMNNESETGEFNHHRSDNIISQNLSVNNNSVDILDVVDVVVDIPTNNTCVELSKCHNVVKVQTKGFTVDCDFCSFTSTRVEEFRKHILVHDNIYDLH